MENKQKALVLSILGILGLIIITIGVTYAFFNYAKEGTTENSITSGTITFLYTEVSEVGRGISIQDAYPMSDEIGKVQVGEGKVFDFKITSNTSNSISIPYEVTARKKNTSTLDENVVKLYLTEVDGNLEEEVLLDNYSNLVQTTRVDSNRYIEKTIYEGKVPVNSVNYEKNFRLRMWIDEDTDFSAVTDSEGNVTYSYSGKEFTLTVNVYANGKVVTSEEKNRKGESLLSILEEEDLETGYYNFEVNGEIYPVHLYVYDGNKTWKNDKTFGDENDVANATEDAKNMVIVKVNGNLTIDREVNVGPYYTEYGGPKGFTLYVTGTLTNNGTIDNSHGAKAEGQDVYLWKNSDGTFEYVPKDGALGGESVCRTPGNPATDGEGRQTGGGGSAQAYNGCSGAGGTGTSYSGGTGSGGGDKGNGAGGSPNGGSGGNASGSGGGAGGGAGNPGGYPVGNGQRGANGTGGLLTIYADKFINNGSITATGAMGGSGNQGGGSSGGGSINIFYHQKMDDRGETTVNGGDIATYGGGKGGKGSTSIGIIENGNYIADKNYRYLVWKFEYTGEEQTFTASIDGPYKIELWGARGGNSYYYASSSKGGNGSYVSGITRINQGNILHVYVGQIGNDDNNRRTSWNGGAIGGADTYGGPENGASGGGATDIRLTSGEWDDTSSLYTRLMVAGGGGGAGGWSDSSGYAGGLDRELNTMLGIGTVGINNQSGGGGGGGGLYGGANNGSASMAFYVGLGANGGSSFVKGCKNCTTDYNAYLGSYEFSNIIMIAGDESMPNWIGNKSIVGNSENGYAKITYIGD